MMSEAEVQVFVYGTLKPGEKYHEAYCGGTVLAAAAAIAPGQLFHLPRQGYPALAPGRDRVQGILLSFASPTILARLDSLEDYDPQAAPEQNFYQRERCEVRSPDGSPLGEVWLYRMALAQIQALGGVYLPAGVWSGRDRETQQHREHRLS
ncbi:MAG: gamma-glutamylcyclotransferase [Synechococcales cyanobacterium RM1_1_8]|nr:gamma-glutamylcyclotransferase [Synechococcales cyanobacterium RM1_1_8]